MIVVRLLSPIWLSVTPWTAARQASLSSTVSRSLLKFMSIESVMLSNYLILDRPLLFFLQSFPASDSFPMSQFFASGGQSIGASTSASVLPMNIQDWFYVLLISILSVSDFRIDFSTVNWIYICRPHGGSKDFDLKWTSPPEAFQGAIYKGYEDPCFWY